MSPPAAFTPLLVLVSWRCVRSKEDIKGTGGGTVLIFFMFWIALRLALDVNLLETMQSIYAEAARVDHNAQCGGFVVGTRSVHTVQAVMDVSLA